MWGYMSDHVGRRPTFVASIVVMLGAGVVSCVAPSFVVFLIARFFVGVGVGGFAVPFDLLAEFLPPDRRGKSLIVRRPSSAFRAVIRQPHALVCCMWSSGSASCVWSTLAWVETDV